jgi:hypothetical protein
MINRVRSYLKRYHRANIVLLVGIGLVFTAIYLYEDIKPIPVYVIPEKGHIEFPGREAFEEDLLEALAKVTNLQYRKDGTIVYATTTSQAPSSFIYAGNPWPDDWMSDKYVFKVPDGNENVIDEFNDGIEEIITNGTYDRIYKKHFGNDDKHRVIWCEEKDQTTALAEAEQQGRCPSYDKKLKPGYGY